MLYVQLERIIGEVINEMEKVGCLSWGDVPHGYRLQRHPMKNSNLKSLQDCQNIKYQNIKK